MRVLQVHSTYSSGTGGEDSVLQDERELLERKGHVVETLTRSNSSVPRGSVLKILNAGLGAVWNSAAYSTVLRVIEAFRPNVVHVHNTFFALSPSVFWAAKKAGVATVLTLHNYRTVCATAILQRYDRPCEACIGRFPLPGLVNRCAYAGSSGAGRAILVTRIVHEAIGTYRRKIDAVVTLSDFQRKLMIRAGWPSRRLYVKPNSASVPSTLAYRDSHREPEFVFVGQLARAKGVDLLLAAWAKIEHRGFRLRIIGDGSELGPLRKSAISPDVIWEGRLQREVVLGFIARASWLVLPARSYEGFPMVVAESLALGTPVIVPNHGPFPEIVTSNGLLFKPNCVNHLAHSLKAAMETLPPCWACLSDGARHTYETRYSPQTNYEQLLEIYQAASANEQRPV